MRQERYGEYESGDEVNRRFMFFGGGIGVRGEGDNGPKVESETEQCVSKSSNAARQRSFRLIASEI